MQPRHYEQLKEIFPELPEEGGIRESKTFFAFNYHLCFMHYDGTYKLVNWESEYDFAHSRNFKTFLEKLKKLRKEMEVEAYRKQLTANVIKSSLEEAGYGACIQKSLGESRIIVWAEIPGNYDFNDRGLVRAYIWDDFVEVYYEATRMYNTCGDPKYKIPGAVKIMIKCINLAQKRLLERSKK